jgi:hypothetical protein
MWKRHRHAEGIVRNAWDKEAPTREGKSNALVKQHVRLAEDLARSAPTADLHVSPFREDGATYGTPARVWCVVLISA